jgi:translation initiation factor IF-2
MHSAGLQETAHDHLLTADEASLVVIELGYSPVVNNEAAFDLFPRPRPEDMSVYPLRPPVVTVMGHVDHGKTSLLDALRKTSVAAGEAGGITQHIGAFSVLLPSKQRITFLDTPGHAAFCAMRARGAQITDIVVLVVAADDGVMPQTIEAIQHAQAANVPIVVAINKCDKPNIDIKRVKEELLRYNVQLEEYGGDVQAVEVSALTGAGLDALEESILVQAELLDIRAETDIPAEGFVLESGVDKGLGNVATVLVKRGTLKRGDTIIAGTSYGRVRTMTTDQGENVVQAGPGTPVKVTGWKELPMAGDELLVAESEEQAKKAAHNRYERLERQKELKALEEINEKRRLMRDANAASDEASASNVTKSQVPELPIVLKGDVSGSVEAVVGALAGLPSNKARIRVIQTGVGPISESDVDMAAAAKGIVLGFNVKCDKRVQQHARAHQVSVSTHNIIYRLLEDAKRRLVDLLPVEYEPTVTGEARILQIFTITLKGRMTTNVAGCRVMNGVMKRNERFRILRNGEIIFDGKSYCFRVVLALL